jgi:hypothetical protein
MQGNRSGRLRAIGAVAALLLLGGCSAAGGLFGSKAADNAGSIASNAGSIADAYDWLTEPGDSFCRKEAGGAGASTDGSGLIPVYKVGKGDCAEGDTELQEYEYNELVAENEAKTWEKLHTAAVAEAAKPTYCRTAIKGIVYRASSNACQDGEAAISEEDQARGRRRGDQAARGRRKLTMPQDDLFEGSNHVLHGLLTQIDFWNGLDGHEAQKQDMVTALTHAAETLRAALQRAQAQESGALGTQAGGSP